jgi:hypothetical protein
VQAQNLLSEQDVENKLLPIALASFEQEGAPPSSLIGLTMGWSWIPDPNDPYNRRGLSIVWRAYFDSEPSESDREFVDAAAELLIAECWSRIVWVQNELVVSSEPHKISSLSGWIFHRNERGLPS